MTVVVKLGGDAVETPERLASDVAHLRANGTQVVVVHGGSTAIDETLAALGREPEYVETPGGVRSRFTDAETMDAVRMATARVNTALVTALRGFGVDAVGLSGVDGGLLTGRRKSAVRVQEGDRTFIRRGDHAGTVEAVDCELLDALFGVGRTPVVTVPVLADDGTAVNADADAAAAAIAAAVGERFVLLTDTPGVYADPEAHTGLFDSVETAAGFDKLAAAADGFMHRKVRAVETALHGEPSSATVSDATVRDPLIAALDGAGTRITETAIVTDE